MELALRAPDGVADVYFQPMDSTAFTQFEAGLIAPLAPYLDDPAMTSPDYDLADFPAGFLAATEYPPGSADQQNYGIPVSFEFIFCFTTRTWSLSIWAAACLRPWPICWRRRRV